MSVELLRAFASASTKADASLHATLMFSLLGLTVALFALPLFGSDYGLWLAYAG
jgi:hypothetical protein